MARPTIALVNTAVNNAFAALASDRQNRKARSGVQALNEVQAALVDAYTPQVDFVVTDTTDATLTAFFAGELLTAIRAVKGENVKVGTVFQVGGAGDTTDNALAAAKGSAVADGDLFEVTNTSTPAVAYLGVAGTLDFSAEEDDDFNSVL